MKKSLLWVLYFDQIEHDRFGTIRQQIWTILHYPLHIAILLTVEVSNQFITFWIARENINGLMKRFPIYYEYTGNDTTAFVSRLNESLIYFNGNFKEKNIPDYNTIPEDDDRIMVIVDDTLYSFVTWLFKTFGFKLSEDLAQQAKDGAGNFSAIAQAFTVVFIFFFLCGCWMRARDPRNHAFRWEES